MNAQTEKAAAKAQGLEPIMQSLDSLPVQYRLEQTGGYIMAVTVLTPGGTWAFTRIDTNVEVGYYPGLTWARGEEPQSLEEWTLAQLYYAARALRMMQTREEN